MADKIIHLVSDSTGETVSKALRACLPQFKSEIDHEYLWSFVHTPAQLQYTIQSIQDKPGLVVFTLIDDGLRYEMIKGCQQLNVPYVSLLDPLLQVLETFLGERTQPRPGMQHKLGGDYFKRMEAVDFAVNHDDGQSLDSLHQAEVVLTGVSRTSKTPCCIYLAYRGVKAANVPLVMDMNVPEQLLALNERKIKPLIIGLYQDPQQLEQVRQKRMKNLTTDTSIDYIDPQQIRDEILFSRRLFTKHNWATIDVTRRSIEETAAIIIQMLHQSKNHMVF